MKSKVTAKPAKPVSAFLLFKKSYELIWQNLRLFILVAGVGLVAQVLSSLQIKVPEGQNTFSSLSPQGAGLFAVAIIVAVVFYTMSVKLQLSVAQGKKTSMGELWDFARDNTFRMVGLGIVISVVVLAGIVAFIVPGIIFIRRYVLAPYVMADKQTGIFESMKISADLSKPFSLAIWGVIGVSLLISLISVFGELAAIVSAVMSVLYSVAPALRYTELKRLSK